MRSSRHALVGIGLLLCSVALTITASGCSRSAPDAVGTTTQSQLASGTADASSAVLATGTLGGADQKNPDGTPKPGSKPLSSSDAEAIDAELSAIEKELDNMSLPSDSDFGGIESGLK